MIHITTALLWCGLRHSAKRPKKRKKKEGKGNNGGDEFEGRDDGSDGEEDRLGGRDERYHRPPLPARWLWSLWQSPRP